MIEVMITVLILCLGLLGVGGLQYLSIKSNQSAMSRAMATEYAYQILDYIRSNPAVTFDENDSVRTPDAGFCSADPDRCNPAAFEVTKADIDNGTINDQEIEKMVSQMREEIPNAWALVCRSDTQDLSALNLDDSVVACSSFPGWTTAVHNRYYVVMVSWEQAGTDGRQRIVVAGEVL